MSALARWFKFKGYAVAGYDKTPSDLTRELEAEGIPVHYEDKPELIPTDIENTLVVYTPAIPDDLGELQAVRAGGYNVRAEVPCGSRHPWKDHDLDPGRAYPHRQRRGLLGLPGRCVAQLWDEHADEPQPCSGGRGGRIRPVVPEAAPSDSGDYSDGRRPSRHIWRPGPCPGGLPPVRVAGQRGAGLQARAAARAGRNFRPHADLRV